MSNTPEKVTYRDVKSDVLSKITGGVWAPGDLLPTEVDLAATYECARATVNRAMRELAEDGIVERRRKAGTRVRMAPLRQATFSIPVVRREIESLGAQYSYDLLSCSSQAAPGWLGSRLGLRAKTRVLHLKCLHSADGSPYQFEDRWINLAALPQAAEADFSRSGPNEWLIGTVPFSNAEISFSAICTDDETARHLGCAAGAALFQAERSTWWEGAAITFVRLAFQPGYRMTTRY